MDNISNLEHNDFLAREVSLSDSLDSFNLSDEIQEDIMNLSQNSEDPILQKLSKPLKKRNIQYNPFIEDVKINY